MSFPIGVPLEPSLYLQPFSIYSAPNPVRARTHTDTRTHAASDFYILSHAMYCIGQTINDDHDDSSV